MPLHIGGSAVQKIYATTTPVTKVYVGGNKVWPVEPPPPPPPPPDPPSYLYDVKVEYLGGGDVRFTALKGAPASGQYYMFSAEPANLSAPNGPVDPVFVRSWPNRDARYCTLKDPSDGGRAITFTVYPQ